MYVVVVWFTIDPVNRQQFEPQIYRECFTESQRSGMRPLRRLFFGRRRLLFSLRALQRQGGL